MPFWCLFVKSLKFLCSWWILKYLQKHLMSYTIMFGMTSGINLWREKNFPTHGVYFKGIQWNLTGSKISTSCTKFVFFGQIVTVKQDGLPGLWLAETFSTSSLKPLKGFQRNLTGSKISTSSTKFVLFGPIGKTKWPPWPLIGWDIFDFSETAEGNSTKLDRKQDLNVLYQVCVFSGRSVNKNDCLGRFLKKVAHCTQVHDMWPFGPLVTVDLKSRISKIIEMALTKIEIRATFFCGTNKAKCQIGINHFVRRPLSVCPPVTLNFCWSHMRSAEY